MKRQFAWITEGKQIVTVAERLSGSTRYFRRRAVQMIRYIAGGATLLASFYYVAQKFGEGVGALSSFDLNINYFLLLMSVALTFVCVVLGGWEWRMLLEGCGADMTVRKALRLHMLSILPKYLPGLGWQQVGKAYLCRSAGIPIHTAALSMFSEIVVALLAAFSLALITLPYAGIPADNAIVEWLLSFPLQLIAAAYLLATPVVLRRTLGSKLTQRITGARLGFSYTRLLFVLVSVACTWALFGLAFSFLIASLYPVSPSQIPSFVLSSTVSLIVSLVAFFAPVGLGVREVTMTFLLSYWLPGPYPVVVAILSRIVLIAAELFSFAVATRL